MASLWYSVPIKKSTREHLIRLKERMPHKDKAPTFDDVILSLMENPGLSLRHPDPMDLKVGEIFNRMRIHRR